MSTVQIRGLQESTNKTVVLHNEQQRELAHLRHRAYRGCETVASTGGQEVHGTFCYRGRTLHQVIQLNKQTPR